MGAPNAQPALEDFMYNPLPRGCSLHLTHNRMKDHEEPRNMHPHKTLLERILHTQPTGITKSLRTIHKNRDGTHHALGRRQSYQPAAFLHKIFTHPHIKQPPHCMHAKTARTSTLGGDIFLGLSTITERGKVKAFLVLILILLLI